MADDYRDRLLSRWGRVVTTFPRLTLSICLILGVASVLLAVTGLQIKADRNALMPEDLEWTARYADYRADFPRWNDIVVCLEGASADPQVDVLSRELAQHLRGLPEIATADAGFPSAQTGPLLWRVAPGPEFESTLRALRQGRVLASATDANSALLTLLRQGEDGQSAADAAMLSTQLAPWLRGLAGEPPAFNLLKPWREGWQPLTTDSGKMRLILVSLRQPANASIAGISESLTTVREEVATWLAIQDAQDIPWGITGIPAIESDETAQATHDSTVASIIAFVLVTMLMLIVFRRIRIPLMAAAALLIGISWSFAWVVISIGHLQLLSMVFSAILIGLGVDFAIHLLTRLKAVEPDHENLPDAMAQTFRDVGPGLLTGGITTAAAFGCTAFSAFLGVAEMGLIAAGGVLLCLMAVMTSLPAMLALTPRWRADLGVLRPLGTPILKQMTGPLHRHAPGVLCAAALLLGGLVTAATYTQYDSNIMNLQPPHLEAVTWQRRLAQEPGEDLWSGLILRKPHEVNTTLETLRGAVEVAAVGGMGMLRPADLPLRQRAAAALAQESWAAERAPSQTGFIANALGRLRTELQKQDETWAPVVIAEINKALNAWHAADVDASIRRQRIDTLNSAWEEDSTRTMKWIEAALADSEPGAADLPPLLRSQWIGTDGRWLLRVAPLSDARSILEPDRLETFINQVRQVAPDVLGPPVQILESSQLIVRAYLQSGLLALLAVLIILLIDFRNLQDALCAMLPVLIGFAGTFGFMGLVGVQLNFANLMVLPMIFGIGVDSGVHVVHRWRSNRTLAPRGLWGGTGVGILLTTLTTAIGFGALMLAEHRGIRSLAIVMVIGLGVTLLACWTVLPAVLQLRSPRTPSQDDLDSMATSPPPQSIHLDG